MQPQSPEPTHLMTTIAVDFDGVIHRYSRGWHDGSIYDDPMPGALAALRMLQDAHAVYVHTTRDPEQVVLWLTRHGVTATAHDGGCEFWDDQATILVSTRKLPALAYVDDRAVRFESWPQTMRQLQEMTA